MTMRWQQIYWIPDSGSGVVLLLKLTVDVGSVVYCKGEEIFYLIAYIMNSDENMSMVLF